MRSTRQSWLLSSPSWSSWLRMLARLVLMTFLSWPKEIVKELLWPVVLSLSLSAWPSSIPRPPFPPRQCQGWRRGRGGWPGEQSCADCPRQPGPPDISWEQQSVSLTVREGGQLHSEDSRLVFILVAIAMHYIFFLDSSVISSQYDDNRVKIIYIPSNMLGVLRPPSTSL